MPAPPGPLTGLKVLDFSQLLPGPFCSMLLADMGAEVRKIEPPHGDALRRMSLLNSNLHPDGLQKSVPGAAFAYLNRNKQSLFLDLKQPDSVTQIRQLIQDYDILIEGFRPGVMARLGLDYKTLSALNPALIYCSISGYGQHGPLAQRAGHDINYISRSGIASLTGHAGQPTLPGVQLADMLGAHQAALAILAAVIARHASGLGQHLDIALAHAAFSLASVYAAEILQGMDPPEMGQMPLSGANPCYNFYRCADGQYLAVGALEPVFQQRLAAVLQVPLESEALSSLFLTRSRDEWCALLQDADACVEPVLSLQEVLQEKWPGLIIEVEVPHLPDQGF